MGKSKHVENMEAVPALRAGEEAAEPVTSPDKPKGGAQMYWDDELNTVVVSATLAALYFGVTKATLSNWVNAGCPRHKYGYYDIKAVSEYRIKAAGLDTAPQSEKDLKNMSLQSQKTYFEKQLKAAQAESAQFKMAVAKGEYIKREEAVNDLKRWAVSFKRSAQGLAKAISKEVAAFLSPAEARRFDKRITEVVDSALEQLSTEGVYHEI
ncbi:MAG: hypothetical protein VB035_06105 [Candidatus Fimivivens sp.]|nr:hypothetical protein [Candidatus Fimivivens sp.]